MRRKLIQWLGMAGVLALLSGGATVAGKLVKAKKNAPSAPEETATTEL